MNIKIHSIPEYANRYKYIVATLIEGQFWFYGAYDYYDTAYKVFKEMDNRLIIENRMDVDSPKHGHWFITEHEYLNCSVCGHSVYTGCESTSEANRRLNDGDTPNYCPNCGAKMDGVSE
jgi:ssDNA-binding Zn-finger/Zn-ribbon topoisomerase 1